MKHLHRWKQFSLRSLMVVTTLTAVASALWVAYGEPWRREQRLLGYLAKNLKPNAQMEPAGPVWMRWAVGEDRCMHLVRLELPGQLVRRQDLEMLAAAPRLRYLKIWTAPQLTSDDLTPLSRLQQVEELDLDCPLLDDAGLKHLEGLHSLVKLSLTSPRITDDGLAHLSGLRALRELRLSCSVTDRGMVHLKPLANLERLTSVNLAPPVAGRFTPENPAVLDESTDLDFNDVPLLDALTYLQERHQIPIGISALVNDKPEMLPACTLKVNRVTFEEGLTALLAGTEWDWTLTAGGISIVGKRQLLAARLKLAELRVALPGLKHVVVDWPLGNDERENRVPAAQAIAELERLGARISYRDEQRERQLIADRVDLSYVDADDSSLAMLAALPDLTALDLAGTRITNEGLANLESFKRLVSLSLSDTQVTDQGMDHVGRLALLEELGLHNTAVGDAGLSKLHALRRLSGLYLNPTQVSDDGLAQLENFPALERIALGGVTSAGLKHLGRVPRLRSLNLEGPQIDDAGMAEVGRLSCLESLTLDGTAVTAEGLDRLVAMTSLKSLLLIGPSVVNSTLSPLERMPQLTELWLVRSGLTDNGLRHLSNLQNLEHLSVHQAKITDAGLEAISRLSSLKYLDITATGSTDAGLDQLTRLRGLRRLLLVQTSVTDAGVERLANKLPGLSIVDATGDERSRPVAND